MSVLLKNNRKSQSLKDIIISKIVQEGAKSHHDIISYLIEQNKEKNQKTIERIVIREFRNLQLKNKYGAKIIACEYHKTVYGNTRYYHNLTDEGIDWYVEKFGLTSKIFWHMSINLFKKKYRFRYAYKDQRSNRIQYDNLDKKSKLEKWSFELFYEEYKKIHNISEKIFNPFGTIETLNSIANYLHEYFNYNKNYFPVGFDYDDWREILPVLAAHIQRDSNKINKVWEQVESGELDQVGKDMGKKELLSRLKGDNILCTATNNDKKNDEITLLGVLLYLALLQFYSYEKNTDEVLQHMDKFLPLIFDKSIWTELIKFKSSKEIHNILIIPLINGFVDMFQESFTRPSMGRLSRLYYYEQKIHYEIKQLFKIGAKIIEIHSKENCESEELIGYLDKKSILPKSLLPYEEIYSKFRELHFIFRQKRENDENMFDHEMDSKKIVIEPISEFISFHFYTYLNQELGEQEWQKLLKMNGRIKKFWDEWQKSIPQMM